MRVSIVTFPGSNCDHDAYEVFKTRGHTAQLIWHKDRELQDPDLVVLPGGFSYGDYLRCGALARFSPIVKEVIAFAKRGGLVMGICNGFQILTECGLLPGTLLMNNTLAFICQHQNVRVETANSPFTKNIKPGTVLDIPIAHKEGNYFIDDNGYISLRDNDQIVFRYCNTKSETNEESNPNGSLHAIAGICDKPRRILGMMPHPERAALNTVTFSDGRRIFEALESFIG